MSRPIRIVLVTLGLCAAGGVFGALAAVVAFLVAAGITEGFEGMVDAEVLTFVAAIGAIFGGFLLPVTAWVLLRRVPLGLTMLGTVVGTVLGGAAGWLIPGAPNPVGNAVIGAVIGFFLAALLLRIRASAPRTPRGVPA